MRRSKVEAIFIGASAGGLSALERLLLNTSGSQCPMIVAMHFPADLDMRVDRIFAQFGFSALEVRDKMPIERGHIYFAAPDYHLLIESDRTLSLSQDPPVHSARPSIDVLFESAALAYAQSACGVLLTGANSDGAQGLLEMQRSGAITIVQDPSDAELATMPRAALALVEPDFIGDMESIGGFLLKLQEGSL